MSQNNFNHLPELLQHQSGFTENWEGLTNYTYTYSSIKLFVGMILKLAEYINIDTQPSGRFIIVQVIELFDTESKGGPLKQIIFEPLGKFDNIFF